MYTNKCKKFHLLIRVYTSVLHCHHIHYILILVHQNSHFVSNISKLQK